MTDKLVAFVSCENQEQAGRIAEAVVTEQLAACVNLVPGIRSCYVWEGKLNWASEVLLVIKTTRGRFEQLRDRIRALHSYELPEIIAAKIEVGLEAYLDWIEESVGG